MGEKKICRFRSGAEKEPLERAKRIELLNRAAGALNSYSCLLHALDSFLDSRHIAAGNGESIVGVADDEPHDS